MKTLKRQKEKFTKIWQTTATLEFDPTSSRRINEANRAPRRERCANVET